MQLSVSPTPLPVLHVPEPPSPITTQQQHQQHQQQRVSRPPIVVPSPLAADTGTGIAAAGSTINSSSAVPPRADSRGSSTVDWDDSGSGGGSGSDDDGGGLAARATPSFRASSLSSAIAAVQYDDRLTTGALVAEPEPPKHRDRSRHRRHHRKPHPRHQHHRRRRHTEPGRPRQPSGQPSHATTRAHLPGEFLQYLKRAHEVEGAAAELLSGLPPSVGAAVGMPTTRRRRHQRRPETTNSSDDARRASGHSKPVFRPLIRLRARDPFGRVGGASSSSSPPSAAGEAAPVEAWIQRPPPTLLDSPSAEDMAPAPPRKPGRRHKSPPSRPLPGDHGRRRAAASKRAGAAAVAKVDPAWSHPATLERFAHLQPTCICPIVDDTAAGAGAANPALQPLELEQGNNVVTARCKCVIFSMLLHLIALTVVCEALPCVYSASVP